MTIGEGVSLVALVLTILGILSGGIWWMSALFFKVKGIGSGIDKINDNLTNLNNRIEDHAKECDKERTNNIRAIDNHEKRIIRLETE
jgi:hypothetical protein